MLGHAAKRKALQAVVDRIPITHSFVGTPYIAYVHARGESPSLLLAKNRPSQTLSRPPPETDNSHRAHIRTDIRIQLPKNSPYAKEVAPTRTDRPCHHAKAETPQRNRTIFFQPWLTAP